MQELKGKTALITGVGRVEGIGMAICQKLASQGVHIFYTYWREYDIKQFPNTASPEMLLRELGVQNNVRVKGVEIDLSQPDAPHRLFETARQSLGDIDILINNACYDNEIPFTKLTADTLDMHYAVNMRAVTLLCSEFIHAWKKQSGGRIINLTSGQSLGPMNPDQIPYTITKAGLEMLAKQLAPEIRHRGITINAVDPGPTDTGWMTEALKQDLQKNSIVNQPYQVAEAIHSLLLEAASSIAGGVIHVGR